MELVSVDENDKLYFPHTSSSGLDLFNSGKTDEKMNHWDVNGGKVSDSDNASCNGYWMASPSASSSDRLLFVRYDGCVNADRYSVGNLRYPPCSFSRV